TTRKDPVTDELHGRKVIDDYRWLEGDNSDPDRMGVATPEVAAWTAEQNAYTRSVLDALPGRVELEERLRPLFSSGSVTAPHVAGSLASAARHFYLRRAGDQNQPLAYWREGVD